MRGNGMSTDLTSATARQLADQIQEAYEFQMGLVFGGSHSETNGGRIIAKTNPAACAMFKTLDDWIRDSRAKLSAFDAENQP